MLSAITNWVLKNRSATLLFTAIILVLGIFAVTQLQDELLPNINLPYLTVSTVYPGASSQAVADQVTTPIEAVVGQADGIQKVQSISLQSYSLVIAQFDFGTNTNSAQQQLTTLLRSVTLPTSITGSALQPSVTAINFNSSPILYVSIEGLQGQSSQQVAQWADTVAAPRMTKQTGIGNVQVVGDTSTAVTITLDPAKLAAHGISTSDVTNTLQSLGLTFAAGSADIASQTVPIRVSTSFANAQALSDVIITSSTASRGATGAPATGAPITGQPATPRPAGPTHLSDVANVQIAQIYPNGTSRTNGQAGVLLNIYKSQNGNTVKASDGVLSEITTLNHDYPAYKLTAVYDQAQSIRNSISSLVREGLLGALFAIVVIFLFLRNLRSTLVTAISLPTSLVVAFILLWSQGITLNTLTLGGLAIAVGRVVDDAIVVLENIYRHVQLGEPIEQAVRWGTREVAGAITTSTLTTIGVFLPLGFIGGIIGQLFLPFALTVVFALAASLVVALTVIPVVASIFIKAGGTVPERAHTQSSVQRFYTPLLHWSLKHRWGTLGIAFGLFVLSLASVVIFQLPSGFLPNSNTTLLQGSLSTPQGTDQGVTFQNVTSLEQVLNTYKQQGKVSLYEITINGNSAFDRTRAAFSGSNTTASLLITLPAGTDSTALAKDLQNAGQAKVTNGSKFTVAASSSFGSGNSLSYTVEGPDAASVKAGSDAVLHALQGVDHLANLKSDVSAVTPQIAITPDPTKSALGNTALIGSQISQLLQGSNAGTITFSDGSQAQILVQVPGPGGQTIDEYIASLKALPLGGGITLGDVATVARVDGVTQVTRIDQSLAATISADITTDNTGGVSQQAARQLRNLALPSGVTVTASGTNQQQSQAFSGLFLAMAAAVALVYLVMVIAFGSLRDPFAILFSLPLAVIGGLGSLVITHHTLDISSLIGFLMLIGIVVTNAIVLMDRVRHLREEQGMALNDALIQAGQTRARPILMTALATILALLPLALGIGGGDEGGIIASDLGVVVIGGLLTSTFLTLIVVPVVYSLLDGTRKTPRTPVPTNTVSEENTNPRLPQVSLAEE